MTRPDPEPQSAPPTPLMSLIRERMTEFGWTYRDLEDRSAGPDGTPGVSRASLFRFATQPLRRNPDPDAIAGLARALDLGVGTVREAVARSLNLARDTPDTRRDRAADIAERLTDLPEPARGHVLWVLERILAGIGAVVRAEPRRDVGADAAGVYDRIVDMTPEQRRRALDVLAEIARDGDPVNGDPMRP